MVKSQTKQKNRINLSVGKCESCGKFVTVLYWDSEQRKWLCKDCKFKKEKEVKQLPEGSFFAPGQAQNKLNGTEQRFIGEKGGLVNEIQENWLFTVYQQVINTFP